MWKVELQVKRNGDTDFYNIDLFDDENITYTRKINDFEKIDTVYGDFSQAFTIPASPRNLRAFDYYHRTDRVSDYDPVVRNEARLFINGALYSNGVVKLLSVGMKQNETDFLKIQFYSQVTNLKDIFGSTKINELSTWQKFNHSNSLGTLFTLLNGEKGFDVSGNIINDTFGAITVLRYGMGSVLSAWQWNTTGFEGEGKRNISVTAYNANKRGAGIRNIEVRPFAKLSYILDECFDEFNVDYENNLVGVPEYDTAYLWLAKGGTDEPKQLEQRLKANQDKTVGNLVYEFTQGGGTLWAFDGMQLRFNSIQYNTPDTWQNGVFTAPADGTYKFDVNLSNIIDTNVAGFIFSFFAEINGVLGPSSTGDDSGGFATFTLNLQQDDEVTFYIGPVFSRPFEFSITLRPENYIELIEAPVFILTTNYISDFVPSVEITKLLSGVMKAYNALIYYDEEQEKYRIFQREDYLSNGGQVDITDKVDISDKTIKPNDFYKKFEFEFEEPEDFLGKEYLRVNGRKFGDISYDYGSYFGDTYKLKLPFTAALGTEIVTTNDDGTVSFSSGLVANLCVDDSYGAVEPGLRIMYYTGQAIANDNYAIREENDTNNFIASTVYARFDAIDFFNNNLFAWNEEFGFDGTAYTGSLFANNYQDYVASLFSKTSRLVEVTAYLPYTVMREIELNDELLIAGQAYVINEMKINLMTGESKLKLLRRAE